MFILTDGKNYIMENPMQANVWISTTSSKQAKQFTFKQARSLLQNTKKRYSWIKPYHMVNLETGKEETDFAKYSNEGIFIGDKEFEFDESIIDEINSETVEILGLAAWDINQLNTYNAKLNQGLSYYESCISDVRHVRMDRRPPANIRTQIDGILNELNEKRRDIKQMRNYVDVMIEANKNQWSLGKIKTELEKARYSPYKGRTKYYAMVSDLLKEY